MSVDNHLVNRHIVNPWAGHPSVTSWTIRALYNLKLINNMLGFVFQKTVVFKIAGVIFNNFQQITYFDIKNSAVID